MSRKESQPPSPREPGIKGVGDEKGLKVARRLIVVVGVAFLLTLGVLLGFLHQTSKPKINKIRETIPEAPRGKLLSMTRATDDQKQAEKTLKAVKVLSSEPYKSAPQQYPSAGLSKSEKLLSKLETSRPIKKVRIRPPTYAGENRTEPFSDSHFELQAIVWSEDPESCLAVINGATVRIGGMVEGITVTEITSDYVAVKSGSTAWKLRMPVRLAD